MGMLDRYKKRGGFVQLVQLIETTGSPKREQFLKMIAEESPAWETAVKQKMLSVDRMCTWNASYLMEFMPAIPAMALACGLYPLAEDKRTILLSSLGFGERKKVEEILKEHKPNSGEIASSQIKIIAEVRKLTASGKLKFEKFDVDLVIPEDIEESLKSGSYTAPATCTIPVSTSDPTTTGEANPTSVAGSTPAAGTEETAMLRRKLVALTQENARLMKENKESKDKLEAIKAAVQKIA